MVQASTQLFNLISDLILSLYMRTFHLTTWFVVVVVDTSLLPVFHVLKISMYFSEDCAELTLL